jgi:hypothetical protein
LKRRQQVDLEKAKQRKLQADQIQQQKTARERRILEAQVNSMGADIGRDPARLLSATKAYEAMKISEIDLDAAQHRRNTVGAHESKMAMGGRDLVFSGRAQPTWMRPPPN